MLWFSEWLHGMFATVTESMRVTARIWDVLMNEGWKGWFRFALAVFLVREEAILSCSCMEDIMTLHKSWTRDLDPDELTSAAFSVTLRRAELRKLRIRVRQDRLKARTGRPSNIFCLRQAIKHFLCLRQAINMLNVFFFQDRCQRPWFRSYHSR